MYLYLACVQKRHNLSQDFCPGLYLKFESKLKLKFETETDSYIIHACWLPQYARGQSKGNANMRGGGQGYVTRQHWIESKSYNLMHLMAWRELTNYADVFEFRTTHRLSELWRLSLPVLLLFQQVQWPCMVSVDWHCYQLLTDHCHYNPRQTAEINREPWTWSNGTFSW